MISMIVKSHLYIPWLHQFLYPLPAVIIHSTFSYFMAKNYEPVIRKQIERIPQQKLNRVAGEFSPPAPRWVAQRNYPFRLSQNRTWISRLIRLLSFSRFYTKHANEQKYSAVIQQFLSTIWWPFVDVPWVSYIYRLPNAPSASLYDGESQTLQKDWTARSN